MQNKKKIIAVILARIGSSRLKNKMIKKIGGKRVIDLFISRLKKCKKIDEVILATSEKKVDRFFGKISKFHKIEFVTGPEKNVLGRIIKSIKNYNNNDIIVRANADCPLFMPHILDEQIDRFKSENYDLYSPFYKNQIPFGFSFVLFKKKTLLKINRLTKKKIYQEHVENFCFENKNLFKIMPPYITNKSYIFCPTLSVTLDNYSDLKKIRKYYNRIKSTPIYSQHKKLIQIYKNK